MKATKKTVMKLFDMKGRTVYHSASTPFMIRRTNMFMREKNAVMDGIRSGNLFMVASLVGAAAACYMAWVNNSLLAVGLTAVSLIVFVAGSAVSFAFNRMEAIAAEYKERETSRDIWESIGRIEDKLEEIETKKTR